MTDIPLDDRGFTLGHGLFETVLWTDGVLAHWDAHVERMERGCRALRLPPPQKAALRVAADAALAAAGTPKRAAVRLNWSAGSGDRGLDPPSDPKPRVTATASALGAAPGPARLVTAHVRRNDRSPASRLKSLSYLDNVIAPGRGAGGRRRRGPDAEYCRRGDLRGGGQCLLGAPRRGVHPRPGLRRPGRDHAT